jgi:DNA replication protein DnaC
MRRTKKVIESLPTKSTGKAGEDKAPKRRDDPPAGLSRLSLTLGTEGKISVKCESCGSTFQAFNLGRWTRRRCPECVAALRKEQLEAERQAAQAEAEARQRRRISEANIPAYWKGKTFQTSNLGINPAAFRHAKAYAQNFDPRKSSGFFLFSHGYGNGKTHLAACIANHVLHQGGYRVRFQKARDLIMDLMHTFTPEADQDQLNYFGWILAFDLLVLDDVGRDSWTEYRENTYWTVFDRRLEAGLPVVVTSNFALYEPDAKDISLGDRIGYGSVSRLRQMCADNIVELRGEDLR